MPKRRISGGGAEVCPLYQFSEHGKRSFKGRVRIWTVKDRLSVLKPHPILCKRCAQNAPIIAMRGRFVGFAVHTEYVNGMLAP